MTRSTWVMALAATVLIQTALSFLSRLIPTLAPVLTLTSGLPFDSVGYLAAAGTTGSILFLACGNPLVARLGPIRALQSGLATGILGVLMLIIPTAPTQFASSFLVGMGYGPSVPAGSDVLLRLSPPHRRTLIFSLKQAGVPLGGVLAGLLLPHLVESVGLHFALLLTALVPLATLLAAQRVRAQIDTERDRSQLTGIRVLLSPSNIFGPFRMMRASARLPRLTLSGVFFACGQGSLFAFLVTYLNQGLGLDLVTSGSIFAMTQVTGIPGRIALGWLADRVGSGLPVLRALSITSAATSLVFAMATPNWSSLALTLLSALAGITMSSWNGIQLAEIAREAPKGKVAETTSGATLVVFLGYVLGPALFAASLSTTHSYATAFLVTSALSLIPVLALRSVRGGRP
ncbi:MAG: MFS transporter [Hyphomicrobiales bacterium]|nr:MFS transporter [Hyphomicrobiales bacterium]